MVIVYLLLGLATLLGAVAALRGYASAGSVDLARATRRTAVASAVFGALLLLLRMPLGLMFLGVGAALPFTLRWRGGLWPNLGGRPGQQRGKRSLIETRHLRMALDHDSGALDGLVLQGKHRDQLLSKLTLGQVLEVRAECLAADPEGVPLIEAYLDRVHGADWRDQGAGRQSSEGAAPRRAAAMTREEALEVLGLQPTASEAEIREAHHSLMMKLHPDHGGSGYLAAKINQARDVLLGT
jgi:hypothetical protein